MRSVQNAAGWMKTIRKLFEKIPSMQENFLR